MSFELLGEASATGAGDAGAAPHAAPLAETAATSGPSPITFNPLDHRLLFLEPRLLTENSAWVGHIPLAFLLIDLLRPRRLVELGTQRGDSYCAFCQAIEALAGELECSATAIDTWAGDPQSGPTDPAALAALRAHHDPLYGRFSTLLPLPFDDALQRFPDRSIDLLHIDGRHDYASVRHDFYAWRPKLSDSAVVLFHDTHLQRPGFDVHRLWDELCACYPHAAFGHSAGLGILAVGERTPPVLLRFLAAARGQPEAVQGLFAGLGQRLELLREQRLVRGAIDEQTAAAGAWRLATGQTPRAASTTAPAAARAIADDLVAAALDAANIRMSLRRTREKLARAHPVRRLVRRFLSLLC